MVNTILISTFARQDYGIMKSTPIKKEVVDRLVDDLGIKDFAQATIREVKQVAAKAEKESGVEFIKMEMGIPGLPAAQG